MWLCMRITLISFSCSFSLLAHSWTTPSLPPPSSEYLAILTSFSKLTPFLPNAGMFGRCMGGGGGVGGVWGCFMPSSYTFPHLHHMLLFQSIGNLRKDHQTNI